MSCGVNDNYNVMEQLLAMNGQTTDQEIFRQLYHSICGCQFTMKEFYWNSNQESTNDMEEKYIGGTCSKKTRRGGHCSSLHYPPADLL